MENNIKDIEGSWQEGIAKNITFIVTKDCQLACKYCYLVGKNTSERMSFNIAKKAVDYLLNNRDLFNEKAVIFDFIGGEPFLEIELIDQICDYIKLQLFEKKHPWFNSYRFAFATNGINYHEKKIQQFIQKNITHLSIGISIDGTRAKHDLNRIFKNGAGSYGHVIKNIPLWLNQFPFGATKVTISNQDIPYIRESVIHLYSLGIKEVNINCVFEDVWSDNDDIVFEDQLIQLADEIIDNNYYTQYTCSFFSEVIGKPLDLKFNNQNWCGTGRMLSIDAAGNFYPCTRFAQYSLRGKKAIIIGNVDAGFDKNKLRPFLTLDLSTQSPQECIDCEVASGCAWCQGENYDAAETSTIYQRATAICKMHKARVRANNYYWNKLFRKLEQEGELENFESKETHITC
ncbi:MAG: radical SAM peptide maturase, CXXX-repeat target family [Candidatus Azobacteroides sp.]|nr:radical SAM peptide maturase, CXXX-repeat target family [Candidatus Azobacteroides sp.]